MGHRVMQRILECAICGRVPEDGEFMWEMAGEYWCAPCCDEVDEENDQEEP